MRREPNCLLLLATATVAVAITVAVTAVGCGFGRADDTGLPIPGQYSGWVCPTGETPVSDAGCPAADAGRVADGGLPADGGTDGALPSSELRRF